MPTSSTSRWVYRNPSVSMSREILPLRPLMSILRTLMSILRTIFTYEIWRKLMEGGSVI